MTKKIIFLLISTLIIFENSIVAQHSIREIKKVVLWGHKLHSHTHSYIHWGFQRAFQHLGYETYWLDNSDKISALDLSNSLFITEGQVDQKIPIRNDCYYIIHNCDSLKYKHLLANGHAIILQVYTHDCRKRNDPAFEYCFHYDLTQPIIYMPWATDLLPHEIDAVKNKISNITKNKCAVFVGTIGHGSFGNAHEIEQFKKCCSKNSINFQYGGVNSVSMEENIASIQSALLAPALQGEWQCKQGYIPCRIFKNISYGALGITNSETVYKLFNEKIVYNPNPYQLCNDALKRLETFTQQDLFELMDFVRDHHTYLDRVERLFNLFELVQSSQPEDN